MRPYDMERIIGGKRYNTATSTLLASNAWWDGHNFERQGRNTFLYKTPNGGFFALHLTQWQGESDVIEPLIQEDAVDMFEGMAGHDGAEVPFAEAFPNVRVTDA